MDQKMGAKRIVESYTKGRMSGRPEYYSGRGAILSDLNSELLEAIFQGIKKEIGDDAAESFVGMVASIDRLSATFFLNSLYALEANGWKWVLAGDSKASDHIDVGPDDDGRVAVGFASMASWMGGGSERNETFMISSDFLTAHGRAPAFLKDYRTKWGTP